MVTTIEVGEHIDINIILNIDKSNHVLIVDFVPGGWEDFAPLGKILFGQQGH